MIVDTQKMYLDWSELLQLCSKLEKIGNCVADIKLDDSFSLDEGFLAERQWLHEITGDLQEEIQNMTDLSSVLEQAISLYEETEQKIMGYPYRTIKKGVLKGKEWSGNFGSGHAIIEEKTKWYQTNEGKMLVSLGVIGLAGAACYLSGGLATPTASALMKATIVGAGGTALVGGTIQAASGGEFEDGFANGALWGGVAGATLGGTNIVLGQLVYGSAKSAIVTYGTLNGWGTGGLYLAEQVYDDKKPTLKGFLGSVGIGAATSMLATGILHNYKLVANTQAGEISKYASSVKSMTGSASVDNGNYSNFADGMSLADRARYIENNEIKFFNEFSERASAAGLDNAKISEAYDAMKKGDYSKMALCFDTSSPKDGAVFWSGNKDGAAAYADSIGGTIMEQTPGGQVFDNWRGLQGMYPEWDTGVTPQKPIWTALSSQYAQGASGDIVYVVREGYVNPNSVWKTVEYPILLDLQDDGVITSITTNILRSK